MSALSTEVCAALDRMDDINSCWKAISDLMTPDPDANTIDRSNLAIAMNFLQREYQNAAQVLSQATHQEMQS